MKRISLLLFVFMLSLKLVSAQAPVLTAANVTVPSGGTTEVAYTVVDFWNIVHFNGTLTWDPAVVTFSSVSFLSTPFSLYPATFNTAQVSGGILSWTWSHPITIGASITDGDAVFKITFTGSGAPGTSSVLSFANAPQPLYYYNFAAWTGPITTVDGLATIAGQPAPIAAFSVAGSGLSYAFTDASTGSPYSFAWDFGDGNTSSVQNPAHTYTTTGPYQVCLTATNGIGSDSVCHMVYAIAPPVADFTVAGTGLFHTFTSTTSGNPTAYAWTFGDGGSSIQQNPVHSYATYGNYQVCLTATNAGGSDSSCHMVYATMTVGIQDLSLANGVSVYAEAENRLIHISFTQLVKNPVSVAVYSLQGQLLLSQSLQGSTAFTLDAGQLSQGIYVVKLLNAAETIARKLFLP